MRAAGSIALQCDAVAGRSRLRSIRCEGLARSSRAFAAPAGAIRVMLSTLGPGVLGGDAFRFDGDVGERASLVAAGQMATPVFAGTQPSRSDAHWSIADGATLLIAGEPLLLEAGSTHAARTTLAIAGSGCAIVAETFSLRGTAALSTRTSARIDGVLGFRDAYDAAGDEGDAFGTVACITASAAVRAAFAERARRVAANVPAAVRIGCGATSAAVVMRLTGARVWDVRAAAFVVAGVTAP